MAERSLVADALARIFADTDLMAADETLLTGAIDAALWQTIEDNGFTLAWLPDELGGAGLSLAEGFDAVRAAGRAALPVPLAETLTAGWLLAAAGIEPPAGPMTICEQTGAGPQRAAFGAAARHLASLTEAGTVRLLAAPESSPAPIALEEDLAAEMPDSLTVVAEAPAPDWLGAEQLLAFGAAVRAAQMSGAVDAVLELTLAYTGEREQFGRPLAKFQAIQHYLADIAGEAAAASAAVTGAIEAIDADPQLGADTVVEIATAKVRCGLAATKVAALAHQAHGAMGFTREYALGRFTRRLWRWQEEFGDEIHWSRHIGRTVLGANTPLWPQIAR